ncbi:MAG TPA: DUF3349 domain-containing protein [Streptosporangiaceae bacterium]|jgi:hypothetical protein|nr:DUF3349 domain-containing protein [Streptosporangiaceae bacterium]
MALSSYVHSILDWVRAGYPEGLPPKDYIPLFALLGTQVTNDDLHAIADELASSSDPQSAAAIKRAITEVLDVKPNDADVARVRARLAEGGWPLARPDQIS